MCVNVLEYVYVWVCGHQPLIITEKQHVALCSSTLAVSPTQPWRAVGPFSRRSEGLHWCMALRSTHMQRHMHKHTPNVNTDTQIWSQYMVCGDSSLLELTQQTHTQTETCPAAFFCVHIHSDINTHETGDTGDSINQKKHTCTHTHTLICLVCSVAK